MHILWRKPLLPTTSLYVVASLLSMCQKTLAWKKDNNSLVSLRLKTYTAFMAIRPITPEQKSKRTAMHAMSSSSLHTTKTSRVCTMMLMTLMPITNRRLKLLWVVQKLSALTMLTSWATTVLVLISSISMSFHSQKKLIVASSRNCHWWKMAAKCATCLLLTKHATTFRQPQRLNTVATHSM